jgi:hypothetical protein
MLSLGFLHPLLLKETIMVDRPGSSSPSVNLQQIAKTFRLTGWISFVTQLLLTLPSVAILLFSASTNRGGNSGGLVFTLGGILALFFTIYWAFRYIIIGRRLENAARRPKKSETINMLRTGLIASLSGMLLALLGQGAILGGVAQKAFSQGIGTFVNTDLSRFVQPLDILVVQASFNVVLAQFVGLSAALWLLYRMNR